MLRVVHQDLHCTALVLGTRAVRIAIAAVLLEVPSVRALHLAQLALTAAETRHIWHCVGTLRTYRN